MDELLVKKKLILVGVLLGFAVLAWWPELGRVELGPSLCNPELLCVVFLDVGQGDAAFIQSPSGRQMLIDTGRNQDVLRALSEVMSFSDRDIDYVMATHPDADHIGGLGVVLDRFSVAHIIRTDNESDTALWGEAKEKIEVEGAMVTTAMRGQRFDLGGGVYLDVLFPDVDVVDYESNASSIVARLAYGEISFMLTGDAPKSIEEYLVLIEGEYLESDVLKVGHHGSRTSTSELFLAEVSPTYAVISAGKDNSYGHPDLEVTDALFNAGVETFNTADHGHIIFWSDGKAVSLK
ncbi:MAG: MBL fold metallo-hydrolase [Candidatus Paceibacterota bacterium]